MAVLAAAVARLADGECARLEHVRAAAATATSTISTHTHTHK